MKKIDILDLDAEEIEILGESFNVEGWEIVQALLDALKDGAFNIENYL